MSSEDSSLSFRATVAEYDKQAVALLKKLKADDRDAAWRFKWEHPRFRDKSVDDVKAAALDLPDARTVVARDYGFEGWSDLTHFTEAIKNDGAITRFEMAVEAIISGDAARVRSMLREHPELARARSTRRHHATLLHYIAANGVEGGRQRTPPNALEIARLLLDAGAEVNALADMYDNQCTTMSMLVSSCHPAKAGLQEALAELLVDYGAALDGRGSKWQSALMTALTFGYLSTAQALARRGAPVNTLPAACGLGRLEDVSRLLEHASAEDRHAALALAAQHGHVDVVRVLLDAGEDPNRYNPDGFHSHSTPLHQSVCAGHLPVVQLLVERGARVDIRDTLYQATPLGWAIHCEKAEIAAYLRAQGPPA